MTLLTEDTKAIILLCGVFGKYHSLKPLSLTEYTSLVRWLINVKMRPGDILQQDHIGDASVGAGIDKKRLESLLGRGVQLGFAVEEWQRNGIWIISRSDTDYPVRYKQHLKDKAPPLLFGVGDRSLLCGSGLGIVGSRNVDQEGEAFTRQAAEFCAYNHMPVVSGGARGVDQISMTTALEAGGVSIGILAENLLKKSVERKYRHAIANGRLLLLSPYHPKARFTVGTAMGRNKLIYAMADFGLVVSAEHKKGGTWSGAQEELKREVSLPVFVRLGNNVPQGNKKLLDLGAIPWPESINCNNFRQQLGDAAAARPQKKQPKNMTLFDFQGMQDTPPQSEKTQKEAPAKGEAKPVEPEATHAQQKTTGVIYEAVLPVILDKLESPIPPDELSSRLEVNKTQLNAWLKKVVQDGYAKKLSSPVRYVAIKNKTPHRDRDGHH